MERPNILLITTDQQRFDGLALNGNPILRTPNLDHWASRGVNFTRAYTTCPSCIAARRSLLTGQAPATHGLVGYQDGLSYDPPFTLPGLLGRVGYQTQLIGKFHMYPQRKRYGFDNLILSEQMEERPDSDYFRHNDYAHWLRLRGQSINPSATGIGPNSWVARPFHLEENLHHSSWLVEEAIDFIARRRDPSSPFFLHLSFWAPHPPLLPPQPYWDRYAERRADWQPHMASWVPRLAPRPGLAPDSFRGPYPLNVMRDAMAGYYGLINHIDDRLAYLINRALERGSPRQKMPLWVVFTSDHGEMLGDHQLFRKSLPYEGSAHVPFFISGWNVNLPRRSTPAFACLEDVLPTVCDLAGVATPAGVNGRSLVPVMRGAAEAVRDDLHGEHRGPDNHFVVSGRHKYCWFADANEEQLFDLQDDPWELRDLSGDAPGALAAMRTRMAAHLAGRTDYTYDPAKLAPLANRSPSALYGGLPTA